jgi:hypothetical protein
MTGNDLAAYAVFAVFVGFPLLLTALIVLYGLWEAFAKRLTERGRRELDQEAREAAELKAMVEATRRSVMIDGEAWEVVTVSRPLIRNRKTGRHAALLNIGMNSWWYITPIRKDGTPAKGEPHWSHSSRWQAVGTIDVTLPDRKPRK